jgi:hypothetical protein
MFTLELTTQSPVGGFRAAVVRFSSNGGNFVQNTYDTTPVAFNAYVQAQTTSKDWVFSFSSDLAVTQLSNTSYAFYLKVYPDTGTGFFSVQHASGDSFAFEGVYTSTTRPAQGVHPSILAVASPEAIGALPVASPNMTNPNVTGTLACQNVTASGTLGVTGASTLASTTASSLTVNGATTLVGNLGVGGTATFLGNVALPRFQALLDPSLNGTVNAANLFGTSLNVSGTTTLGTTNAASLSLSGLFSGAAIMGTSVYASSGFTSVFGSFSATTSFQNLVSVAGRRGFLFLDGQSPINSSVLAYFSCISTNQCLSIVAQNGNAYSFANVGSSQGTGSMMINVGVSNANNLRVSATQSGTINWAIVYFPNTV